MLPIIAVSTMPMTTILLNHVTPSCGVVSPVAILAEGVVVGVTDSLDVAVMLGVVVMVVVGVSWASGISMPMLGSCIRVLFPKNG